jgi:transcriptional regulator with XRE-family HTH domain
MLLLCGAGSSLVGPLGRPSTQINVLQGVYSVKKTDFSPAGSERQPQLTLESRLARLFRALTPFTQDEFAERAGIHPKTLARYEIGKEKPGAAHLEAMARVAGITIEGGLDHLRLHELQTQPRLRPGRGADAVFEKLAEEIRARAESAYQSLLRLPRPASDAESQQRLEDQIALLRVLDEPGRFSVVKSTRAFQTAALADRVAAEAAEAAPRNAGEPAAWTRLAKEIARLASPEVAPAAPDF